MTDQGMALMGTGRATGPNRAIEAASQAIDSPLLEDVTIDGATGILLNLTGGRNMSLNDVHQASTQIQEAADEDAEIIFGAVIDDTMEAEELKVTVIATGFDRRETRRAEPVHNMMVPKETHDIPTKIRLDRQKNQFAKVSQPERVAEVEEATFDVPAFMRRRPQ
jgi:cell division protein FtsZ